MVSAIVHTYESFKVGREFFGIMTVTPKGEENHVNATKTKIYIVTMKNENEAPIAVQVTEDENKNSLSSLAD